MEPQKREHFILIKKAGFDNSDRFLSASECANALLDNMLWPLYEKTRCQHMVQAGHRVLIYLAGDEADCKHVIAKAEVNGVELWNSAHKKRFPLMLDGVPNRVLILKNVVRFERPVDVRSQLRQLSFIPANHKKWGVALMGGMRSISATDYAILCGEVKDDC